MKKFINMFTIGAMILLIVSAISFYNAGDKKNNYYYSENYPILSENAYVGGDAYNYIINSNYFTGYIVLGSCSGLGAIILLATSSIVNKLRREEKKEDTVKEEIFKDETSSVEETETLI